MSTGLPALIQAEHRLAEDDTCGILFLSVLLAYLRGNVEPQGASLDDDRSVIYALLRDLIEALPKVFLPVYDMLFPILLKRYNENEISDGNAVALLGILTSMIEQTPVMGDDAEEYTHVQNPMGSCLETLALT